MVVFVENTLHTRAQSDEGPTPEMIEQRAAEIRERWSPRVRRRRRIDGYSGASVTQMPLLPRRKGTWGE